MLWVLERRDHIESIERNLRAKVIAPDFRYPYMDGRLALAKLLALLGRLDQPREWFAKARRVLEEEGARPRRAVVDLEEAIAHVRREARVTTAARITSTSFADTVGKHFARSLDLSAAGE